ncbi:BolA protein [Rubricella aquisinus]|uniref:BolA protein n=1 Tax=Rubricella aquisinus TaxID=2028108 RepID=A0A840WZ28_9RHOB|nr:BolA family protein [Rubricella aquisinus]MBB5515674.1 BolA protein [Rubricella aquisinus]
MRVAEQIELKLKDAFAPTALEVVDESHLHAGHAGAPEGGQSHFRVTIRAAEFAGKSRVAQQRAIYAALKEEMAGPIHALALDVGA